MEMLDDLTYEKLIAITECSNENAAKWLPYFKSMLPGFGIVTKERIVAFLSQVAVESAGLSAMVENLNYSAVGLANTWPTRYASRSLITKKLVKGKDSKYMPNATAAKLARKPEAIANHCYSSRMGNGDEASGDGWKYRGRGLKQVTGRFNYTRLAKDTGLDFITHPEWLEQPSYAILSACWFWQSNKLSVFADKKDIVGLTKAVNGGANGLTKRQSLFNKALGVL
jgi:putative chitinase